MTTLLPIKKLLNISAHSLDSGKAGKNDIAFLGLGVLAGLALGALTQQRLARQPRPLPALNGKMGTALITGASSGIGAAFARRLAGQGYDLVLVARREARLKKLAGELQRDYPVQVEVLTADLADPTAVTSVEQRIRDLNDLTLLVNNAAFGSVRGFAEANLQKQVTMIDVNVVAGVRLAYAALSGMLERNAGVIINVSSVAGYLPVRANVTYGATKSYMTAFSKALQAELHGSNVRVQALCPGFTFTEFHDTPEFEKFERNYVPRFMWMTAEAVVEASLAALKTGQVVVIPGVQNRLLVALTNAPLLGKFLLAIGNWEIKRRLG